MHHKLKILPVHFEAVLSGDKNFEIRYNRDRDFQRGDTVELQEYDPGQIIPSCRYTGRAVTKRITYVTGFEQKEDYVVFGMVAVEDEAKQ